MKCVVFLNHNLTQEQKDELKRKYNIDENEIVYPDKDIQGLWLQIPTDYKINRDVINRIVKEINRYAPQYVIIQGETGHTFTIIDYCLNRGIIPLHAVSERKAVEVVKDGVSTKTSIFEHKCFRKYERYK